MPHNVAAVFNERKNIVPVMVFNGKQLPQKTIFFSMTVPK